MDEARTLVRVIASGAGPEGFFRGGDMASAGARAYSEGLGTEPPAGSRGRAPGQGAKPPEAESLSAFVGPRETANLPSFPQIF